MKNLSSGSWAGLAGLTTLLLIGFFVYATKQGPLELNDPFVGSTFQYPELSTKYISGQTWPPTAEVTKGPLRCNVKHADVPTDDQTESRTIDEKMYCVTTRSEGAAGSVYTEYAYASEVEGNVVTLSFALRFVQCENYDGSARTACETERESFDPDDLIAQIVPTLKLTQ